ncbi:beta strand repeat-containing protein [Novosphingobium acidiphilum]|uniref:beta strand repeat-containing protein n=1 Tax=Novosphingobium acidiphilum TaxID=505248 RepID=UPI0012EC9645|nr:hypothetical protein [Novosphingobium acidiphilum]
MTNGGMVNITTSGSVAGDITVTNATGAVTVNQGDGGNVAVSDTGTGLPVIVTGGVVDTIDVVGAVTVTGTASTTTVSVDAHNYIVSITDGNYAANTAAGTITHVSLTDAASGSIVADNALTTLDLSGVNSSVEVNPGNLVGNTNTDLTLNLHAGSNSYLAMDAGYSTLHIDLLGDATLGLANGGVSPWYISGSGTLSFNQEQSTNVTLVLHQHAGLTGLTMVGGSLDASDSAGSVNIATNGSTAIIGGSGDDTINVLSTTITQGIGLGSGTNTLTLATGTTTLDIQATVFGGTGSNNTLVMDVTDAAADSADNQFASAVSGFQILSLSQETTAEVVDLPNLGAFTTVISAGAASTGTLTLDGFADNGTLELAGVGDVTVNMASGATALNIALDYVGAMAEGTVTAAGVQHLSIAANDMTASVVAGTNTDTLTFADTAATAITVTGNANLVLTPDGSAHVISVDASGMTGGLNYTTAVGDAQTVHGGQGANIITASNAGDVVYGGAGSDQLTAAASGVTLYAGSAASTLTDFATSGNDTLVGSTTANDTFIVGGGQAGTANNCTVIQNVHSGDVIMLASAASFLSTEVTVSTYLPDLQTYLNAAVQAAGASANSVEWFQYAGNTYLVENHAANENHFTALTDQVVELHGLVNLSSATFSSGGIHMG